MPGPHESFEALVEEAVERFLKSAIVIDDRAEMEELVEATPLRTPTPELEVLTEIEEVEADGPPPADEDIPDPGNTPLNATAIVDAFAARGVICGILRPTPRTGDEVQRIAPRAISNADLVILDWHLRGDDGQAALAILGEALADAGHAMRLVAIYTGDPNLPRVASSVAQHFDAELIEDVMVQLGPVRIVVIGKADPDAPPTPGAFAERDLPTELVRQFVAFADGLVRSVALAAMGALRGATYRLLAGLDRGVDLGYIGHRALVFPSSEAEDHVIGMLAAEARSIVEDDELARTSADAKAVALWLEREASAGRPAMFSAASLAAMVEADLFDTPSREALKLAHPELASISPRRNELTRHLTTEANLATVADERFAMLMTLRTVYDRPDRVLSLGAIVADDDGRYWFCIQPACDSLRITGSRRFPFLPLVVDPTTFDFVVKDGTNSVRLKLSRKPSEIEHWTFEASRGARSVVARGDTRYFRTTSGKLFRWVAQLNEGHAQRAAQDVGAEQSRIGLAESDWLRRKG